MEEVVHESKTFDGIDYSEKKLQNREFINCTFHNCNFTKSDLSNNDFVDCIFNSCNFSLTLLRNTGLKDVKFVGCKLLGLEFNTCSDFLFSAEFSACYLDYSSFIRKKMKKTSFVDCSLKQVEFSEADLTMASFENCDLQDTTFFRTILEKADFRSARNFSIDPELNRMKGAKFSSMGLYGLLTKYNLDIQFD